MGDQANIYKGPRTDEYETPGWVFDPLMEQYRFGWDLAASAANTKAPRYFSEGRPFQEHFMDWIDSGEVGWLNKPFSRAEEFCRLIGNVCPLAPSVLIYKSGNMESRAWRHLTLSCSWIAQPHKRVEYLLNGERVLNPKTGKPSGCQFASALIGFGVEPPKVPWSYTLLRVDRSGRL